MSSPAIPERLRLLHGVEENLRRKALAILGSNPRLALHAVVTENAMHLADLLLQYPTHDEDIKTVQVLGMRTHNAFGASLKLALSGYGQNSALIMRDILETVFLLELFRRDADSIERFRFADRKVQKKIFGPPAVRKALEDHDGPQGKWRQELYERFSRLASHPTMDSAELIRPHRGGDVQIGPFVTVDILSIVLPEMGRCAVVVGETLDRFLPETWADLLAVRETYRSVREHWRGTFWTGGVNLVPDFD